MHRWGILLCLLALDATARLDIEPLARTCNGCHGVAGVSVGLTMPSIGGQPAEYLKRVMKQWKYGVRSATIMNRIVKGLTDDEIDALADHFARQPWQRAPQTAAADILARGKETVERECRDCHGAGGDDPDLGAPRLDGQWARYLELEMSKYRSNEFAMPHRKMRKAARAVTAAEATAAVRFYAAQGKGK